MLALVRPVLLDRGDEPAILRIPRPHRLEHPIDRRIPAMLVIDIDRAEQIEIAMAEVGEHLASLSGLLEISEIASALLSLRRT